MKRVLIGFVIWLIVVGVGVAGYFIGKMSSTLKDSELVAEESEESIDGVEFIYYDKPEDAILKMVESINEADIIGIKEAFGIAVKTEGFDYEKFAKRLQSITPSAGMPDGTALYREMNEIYFTNQIYTQLQSFFMVLNTDIALGTTVSIDPEEQYLEDFIANYEDIQEIEDISIYRYTAFDDKQVHQENMVKQSDYIGAEKYYDCLLVFKYDRDDYILGITVYEYNDGYVISGLYSGLLGIAAPELLDDNWQEIIDNQCVELY